ERGRLPEVLGIAVSSSGAREQARHTPEPEQSDAGNDDPVSAEPISHLLENRRWRRWWRWWWRRRRGGVRLRWRRRLLHHLGGGISCCEQILALVDLSQLVNRIVELFLNRKLAVLLFAVLFLRAEIIRTGLAGYRAVPQGSRSRAQTLAASLVIVGLGL